MHLGLIMDGNGRWAQQRQLPRTKGHEAGFEAAKRVALAAKKFGVDYVTVYAFSTENWKRPAQEVNFLMKAIEIKFSTEIDFFLNNNIKILVRGNIDALPAGTKKCVLAAIERTASCTGMTAVIALNYGGHDEIKRAVNKFIANNPGKMITEEDIQKNLDLPSVPAPDMIARSAGEKRLSNFLLWDSAYSEFFFIDKLWPDWGEEEVKLCIDELSKRVRKFGGIKNETV